MATSPDPCLHALDSALLLLSREPKLMAALFTALLHKDQVATWANSGGQRKAGRPDPALQLAEIVAVHNKVRAQVAAGAHAALPTPEDTESPWAKLAGLLRSEKMSDWEAALEHMQSKDWSWPSPPITAKATQDNPLRERTQQAQIAPPAASSTESEPALQEKVEHLQSQLKTARQEAATLQEEIGQERRRRHAEDQERSAALAAAETERQRATELKQQLASSNSASEREVMLEAELKELRHALHVVTQKVDWLEEERDDLHGLLADHDRFDALDEEQIPSFRDRPLTQPEQELTAALAQRDDSGHSPFRVLVVGGGKPQHRHQGKLAEYADSVGFQAHWRMAEYQAWHRALDGLRRDMHGRFDALIILHWNRTTFTRKAREICDSDGDKPCLTCHYEGFTNLRESLQECLRELLAGAKRAGD
ncbi:MAG: hypothetical protein MK209_02495 [Planctomycetes bacterium]|nr:hypothetical protein [Planctomycetota bacterium]